ncbi:hypothetical protein FOZ61_010586 [Perkinsus olseni]|uniref:Uncharacterized protein n=1 Tax=Perkinsus olseni TaxID=32597 RepID=A0A7J6KVF9_PEROL|nr:hypothetical protein FOZ61_010586 [Perkinsus olseni]
MAASSSAAPAESDATNWWSMQGLRDVPAERPDNEQVPERVYEIVDGILAIEDKELTFCLSLGVMRSLVKIPALEQIFTERNPIVIGRILKALGFEGSEPAGKAAPANRIENKIELNSLPLVEAAPWDADGKDADSVFMTYDIFKKRVQSACKSYQLKGRLACYYLSRNLVGRAKTFCQGQLGELTELEDEVGLQRDISELLWERLDEKFANLWSEGRAVSNFGKVYKKADESVLSFCGRVQELGETLPRHTRSKAARRAISS